MASGRSCSLTCRQLGGCCVPWVCLAPTELGIGTQRVLRVALRLDATELDQGATRDGSHGHQTEDLTLHEVHVHGEITESWSCDTYL